MHDSLIYAVVNILRQGGGVAGNAVVQFPAILLFIWMHLASSSKHGGGTRKSISCSEDEIQSMVRGIFGQLFEGSHLIQCSISNQCSIILDYLVGIASCCSFNRELKIEDADVIDDVKMA